MKSLARWSAGHPVLVILVWLLAIVGVQVSAQAVGADFRNSFALPGTDSQAGVDLLHSRFPAASGDADTIVVTAKDGAKVTDPAVTQRMQSLFDKVTALDSVTAVHSPYAPTGAGQVNADTTVAYASVQYDAAGRDVPRADLEALVGLVHAAEGDGLDVAVGGQGVAALEQPQIGPAELIGVAFAVLILLLAFGSPVAAALPIVSAAAALGVATGVVRLASNVTTISDVAPVLGVLLGLGVGIDYALFIVNRHRGNLRAGMPVSHSIVAALDTSGRAVVFAGITVVIALLGLFLTGIEFLYGLAIGASVSVVFTVLSATTLIPALLGALGLRVLGRRARRALLAGKVVSEHSGGEFRLWARLVQGRPIVLMVLALGVLLTIAVPVLDLRLGTADQGNDPAGTTTRRAYDALADGFGPGINGPLILAVDLTQHPITGKDASVLQPLVAQLKADPGVASIVGPMPNPDGTAALLRVIPTTSPQDKATSDLIDRVRTQVAPQIDAASGIHISVGGPTATFDDFATQIQAKIPLFVSVVIGLSMLLLVLAFRSLLIPLVGAVMNLISVAAAFGVVVAVFQWGWAANLIGLGKGGPIEPFLPVVLFAMLFGLSMDYQVFLVSRMHEEWLRTGDNTTAVRTGHADTGKVIVAAASIMVFVFGAFVFGDSRTIKLMGLGMASAVLLDAFLIRMLIVPAVMHRIGPANWWLPRWLDRVLPHLSVEGSDVEHPVPPGEAERAAQGSGDVTDEDDDERGYRRRGLEPGPQRQTRTGLLAPRRSPEHGGLGRGARKSDVSVMSEREGTVERPGPPQHRPTPVDTEPRGRLDEVLGLLDELTDVARVSEGMFRGLEQVTGLRAGEVYVLLAVAHGASPVREVARRIGELDDAAGATVESLIQRGLLARNHRDDSRDGSSAPGFLHLTDQGAALLEQIEGSDVEHPVPPGDTNGPRRAAVT